MRIANDGRVQSHPLDAARPCTEALPESLHPGQRWYIVQSLAKREYGALFQLEAQHFRAFCPSVLRTVRHARRTRTVRTAFFPGYLFVALDLNRDRWRSINGTFGVSRLLSGKDGAPAPVPTGVVESLLGYVDAAGVCRFDRDLKLGQDIRVTTGPFADVVGKLVRLDSRGRVQVLLEILGGQFYATVERSALSAA